QVDADNFRAEGARERAQREACRLRMRRGFHEFLASIPRGSGRGLKYTAKMHPGRWIVRVVLAATLTAFAANVAIGQDAIEAFYRGRTVTMTVGSAVGGGYDTYARLLARHLGRHIPGDPQVIVQNMAGAGSNKAVSYVALQAPRDGSAI